MVVRSVSSWVRTCLLHVYAILPFRLYPICYKISFVTCKTLSMNREKTRVSMLGAIRLKYITWVRFLVLLRVTLTPPFPRIVIFSPNQVLLLPFWLQLRSNLQNYTTGMCAKSSKNMSKLSCNNINFCGECLWVWYWNMEVCNSSVSLHFISTLIIMNDL